MAKTRAQANREIRQEALRGQLEANGHLQQVIEIAEKLSKLDDDKTKQLDAIQVQRLKAAADIHLKLISKYLPDMKSIEHSGDIGINKHEDMLEQLEHGRESRLTH